VPRDLGEAAKRCPDDEAHTAATKPLTLAPKLGIRTAGSIKCRSPRHGDEIAALAALERAAPRTERDECLYGAAATGRRGRHAKPSCAIEAALRSYRREQWMIEDLYREAVIRESHRPARGRSRDL